MKRIMTMMLAVALVVGAQTRNEAERRLKAAQNTEVVDGDLNGAIEQYEAIVSNYGETNRAVAAEALIRMAGCYEKLGTAQAREIYERVVSEFGDQADPVVEARSRIAALGGSAPRDGVRVRRLLEDALPGRPSRNGSLLALVATDGSLRVYDLGTGASRPIVPAPANRSENIGSASVVSPDGKQVAYSHINFETVSEIRVVKANGANDRLLFTSDQGGNAWPEDWSADGREILGQHLNRGTHNLLLITTATGESKTILTLRGDLNNARYSPDGRHVFYGHQGDIFSISIAGGEPVPVVNDKANDVLVGFAPDGRLVFLSNRTGRNDIWALAHRNGNAVGSAELILSDFGQNQPIAVTRDGALLYSTNHQRAEVYTVEVNASGRVSSGPTPISSRFVGVNTVPDYSADGQFLAYVSGMPDSVQSDIRIRTVATGEERSIPKPVRNIHQLRWYPDGKSLLISGGSGSGPGFYRLDVESGASTKILDGIPSFAAVNPTFSPDGQYLYYEVKDADSFAALMRMDVATGAKEEVLRPPAGYLRIYSLSPDGTQIVYNWRRDGQDFLYLVPVSGGEPRLLHDVPRNKWARGWGGLAWSADGRSVLYHRSLTRADELFWIPVSGGDPVPLLTTGIVRRIAMHPDGRHITFEARTSTREVSIMENLFPN